MAKTPRALIRESRKEIRSLMQANLLGISEKIINQIMANYKSLPDSRKINATNKLNIPAGQNYKLQLREALSVIARESIELAKEEVPSNIKFAEYDKLPPAIRRYLEARAQLYVATQIGEISKKISFNFSDAILQTDSPDQVMGAMTAAATAYVEGPAVAGGSAKVAADSVNYARKQYFEDPEVNDQIEAFQYVNIEPVSDICKDLAGHVFRKDDPELDRYTPPFHFNAVLEGEFVTTSTGKKKIEDVVVGDMVLTHTDTFQEVYQTMDKFEEKHYFEIELENGIVANLTGEHPIYSKQRGWIRTDELELSDDIVCVEDIKNGFKVRN